MLAACRKAGATWLRDVVTQNRSSDVCVTEALAR